VEAQGGRVGVTSTPNQGSTFFAILPYATVTGINERDLRTVVRRIDWDEQRKIFQKVLDRFKRAGQSPSHDAFVALTVKV
jgi:hypothetical protein